MEKKIDIIPFLEGIMEENTQHYQEDFARDEKRPPDGAHDPRRQKENTP